MAKKQFVGLSLKNEIDDEAIYQFFLERLKTYLRDQLLGDAHFTAPEIESILSMNPGKLNDLPKRLQAIRGFTQLSEATQLAVANKRISNILKKTTTAIPASCSQALLQIPAETALFKALEAITPALNSAYEKRQFVELLKALSN
jgi:glycyl-tRNA synthetase beta chain